MRTLLLLLAILCLRYFLVELLQAEHGTDAPVKVVELHVQEVTVGRQLVVACRANRILVCVRLGLGDQRRAAWVSPTLAGALALLEGRVGCSLSQPGTCTCPSTMRGSTQRKYCAALICFSARGIAAMGSVIVGAPCARRRCVRSSGFYPWTLPARLRHAT